MTNPAATANNNRDFFDTNILIYAHSRQDPAKMGRALDLLTNALEHGTGVLSAQVLGEFFTISTSPRRVQQPLTREEAIEVIYQVSVLTVVSLDLPLVRRGLATCQRYQISYWDGLIVAAAERAGCTRVFTEDLNDGQTYHGVVAINPF